MPRLPRVLVAPLCFWVSSDGGCCKAAITIRVNRKEPIPPVNVSCRPRAFRKRLRKRTRVENAGNCLAAFRVRSEEERPLLSSRQMSTGIPLWPSTNLIIGTRALSTTSISEIGHSARRSARASLCNAVPRCFVCTPVSRQTISISLSGRKRPVSYEPKARTLASGQTVETTASKRFIRSRRAASSARVGRKACQKSRSSS